MIVNGLNLITKNLARTFASAANNGTVLQNGTGSHLFKNLIPTNSVNDLGGLAKLANAIPLTLFQPSNKNPDNSIAAGTELAKPIIPIAVKALNLAASPNHGLLPDPVKTLTSWFNFAMNRGAGEISNGWVGASIGSRGNDHISPTSLASLAWGGAGHDTIQGNLGLLFAHGGKGNDTLIGANGIGNILAGGAGNDQIQGGTALFNVLLGGAGSDTLKGGTSLIGYANGGSGNDTVVGGYGLLASIAKGGAGNDRVVGGSGLFTHASGGEGDDHVVSGRGKNNTAAGNAGNDIVESSGRGKKQVISGGDGNDLLVARSGKEKIRGGDGFDTLVLSGKQSDYCVKQTKPGELEIIRYQMDKQGNLILDKQGNPKIASKQKATGIENIKYAYKPIPLGKARI